MADRGYAASYEYAFRTLEAIPYNEWRELNPEDTVRFHSLRLPEVSMIMSAPQKLLAQGADWRFLSGLKKESKG